MNKSHRELLESDDFRHMLARRWRVSLVLTALLFVLYYGYIMLIAVNRELLSAKIGDVTTLGIPLGAAVIVGAWVLTAVYVVWANRQYDPEVAAFAPARSGLSRAMQTHARVTDGLGRHLLPRDRRAHAGRHLLGGATHASPRASSTPRVAPSARCRTAWRSPATT